MSMIIDTDVDVKSNIIVWNTTMCITVRLSIYSIVISSSFPERLPYF